MTYLIFYEVNRMTPHAPTPDEAEHAIWLFKFWKEILSFIGVSLATILGYFKLKERTVIPMSVDEIERRLTIREQKILLQMQEELNTRDKVLFDKIQEQSDRTIDHIKDLIK